MITRFKLFENNTEESIINDMFSRVSKNIYMKWMSEADIDLFTVDDKFDELEARTAFLDEQYGIQVKEVEGQNLISFDEYVPEIKKIVGDYPILLYHYTSENLLESVLKDGLIKGYKKTNPFTNSYSGVYLTTEVSGNAVRGYVIKATQKHGGYGIQLYIKTYFSKIQQDPDDADLKSGRYQFITDYVPPQDIIFHERYFA